MAPQMLITIFGDDLASGTETARISPLPTTLAGTSVTIGGLTAPLLYASPIQINAQVPSAVRELGGTFPGTADVVVTTANGSSAPASVAISYRALGIFTQDASGCGQGAVFNVHPDGSLSLNTPDSSFDPQTDWGLTIFLTGLGAFPGRQDGVSAAYNPKDNLAPVNIEAFVGVQGMTASGHVLNSLSPSAYLGPAPALVGVDQMNTPIFPNERQSMPEGCHLPLVISDFQFSTSQIVNVSIHRGGGACVDFSLSSLVSVAWKKNMVSDISGVSASDAVSVQFLRDEDLAFPRPTQTEFLFVPCCSYSAPLVPRACPSSLPRPFAGGPIRVSGPGFGPLEVSDELTLPPGTIGGGDYQVASSAFTATAHMPRPITVTSNLAPGTTLTLPVDVTWTGGDEESTVTVEIVVRPQDRSSVGVPWLLRPFDQRVSAAASRGSVQIGAYPGPLPFGGPPPPVPSGEVEIILRQEPATAPAKPFSVSGLSMGGEQRWMYSFDYRGLKH